MRAFELYVNGKKIGTAGVGDYGVLSAIVTWVGRTGRTPLAKRKRTVEDVGVVLGGLISETEEHLRWHQQPLGIGDEVSVKVIEAASVDRPRHRQKRNRKEELRQQKAYVRRMAKTFGWKIVVPR
jgi:hypothetical protein